MGLHTVYLDFFYFFIGRSTFFSESEAETLLFNFWRFEIVGTKAPTIILIISLSQIHKVLVLQASNYIFYYYISRLQQVLQMEAHIVNHNDRSQFNDLQSLLCGTLQSVLRKMTPEDAPQISDTIMTAMLTMFSSNKSGGECILYIR